MSLISFTHIQWEHRLFHRGLAKTGSSLVTFRTEVGIICCHINMGTSFITSKYFFFKRHLSSGRCRYCFLETQPNTLINYTCWKKTSFPPKSKFSWNFILFAYIPIRKEIFVQSFVLPASLLTKNLCLDLMTADLSFLVVKERFKWNVYSLPPAEMEVILKKEVFAHE